VNRGLVVEQHESAGFQAVVRPSRELSRGEDVHIKTMFASLNHKDRLVVQGRGSHLSNAEFALGTDAVGEVVWPGNSSFRVGEVVVIVGGDLGARRSGTFADIFSCNPSSVYSLPSGLQPKEAALIGTAGVTAAIVVDQVNEYSESSGGSSRIAVTGANGSVGVYLVSILAKLGYKVDAFTRGPNALLTVSSSTFVRHREIAKLIDIDEKTLMPQRWDLAVDNLGGRALASLLNGMRPGGQVMSVGNVLGSTSNISLLPFIIRGVVLKGVNLEAESSYQKQVALDRLATSWRTEIPESWVQTLSLEEAAINLNNFRKSDSSASRVLIDFSK